VLGVALAGAARQPGWSWLKWLPHVDIPGRVDGVSPATWPRAPTDWSRNRPHPGRAPGVRRCTSAFAAPPADRGGRRLRHRI
jgi:hypothetical protein